MNDTTGTTLVRILESCLCSRSFTIENMQVRFRLLKKEDLDLWIDFVNGCSKESLWQRFMAPFSATPERAQRFCDIDPEKELAVIAEMGEGVFRKVIGIARLIKLSCSNKAEFAVIVSDPWQKKTLGHILSELSVGLVRFWGVKSVFSETIMENRAAIEILKQCSFKLEERNGNVFTMSLQLAGRQDPANDNLH
jgi:acetyltransferase